MPSSRDVRITKRAVQLLRADGVIVYEQPGCYAAGGTYKVPMMFNTDHHDASSVKSGEWGAHGYCLAKRICTTFIPRCWDGVEKVSIIAAGTAPHAGVGSWPGVPTNDGNAHMGGTEKANAGGSEGYTAAAYRTQVKVHRAYAIASAEEGGRTAMQNFAVGHKEYGNRKPGGSPGRKNDPNYSMDRMRADVAAHQPGQAEGDDDMSAADVEAISRYIDKAAGNLPQQIMDYGVSTAGGEGTTNLRAVIGWSDWHITETRRIIREAAAQVAAEAGDGDAGDPAVADRIVARIDERLASLSITLTADSQKVS